MINSAGVGFIVGLVIGVGLTFYQAERVVLNGEPQLVVAWVRKNQVVETPVLTRVLVAGLGCAFLGATAGYRLGAGGGLLPAFIGALLLAGAAHYVMTLMPNPYGRAGDKTRETTLVFAGFLGAAAGAEVSVRARNRRPEGRTH